MLSSNNDVGCCCDADGDSLSSSSSTGFIVFMIRLIGESADSSRRRALVASGVALVAKRFENW